jgi:protein gp37
MAETSNIAWTKSTVNFWIGCTKVSPGCDGCYAEHATPSRTMGIEWGAGKPRHRTAPQTWNQLDRWNKQAPDTEFAGRKGFWPVFIDSLSDFFDNEVPELWREQAWAKMKACPNLTFLIVTKRIGNAARMLPADWGDGYPNVWIIATVVNQEELDRDIGKLVTLPAAVRGLSIEPQLERISLRWLSAFPGSPRGSCLNHDGNTWHLDGARRLDWVICGGESDQPGHPAREFRINWAEQLAAETAEAGVAFFMKQLGHKPTRLALADYQPFPCTGKGEFPEEWPATIQRREFPVPRMVAREEVAC